MSEGKAVPCMITSAVAVNIQVWNPYVQPNEPVIVPVASLLRVAMSATAKIVQSARLIRDDLALHKK